MNDATRREPDDADATRRESTGGDATRREAPGGPTPPPSGAAIALPSPLSERYTFEEQLPTKGAEATLIKARDASDTPRIIKLYHPYITLDDDTLARVRTVDLDHVVEVVDHGRTDTGAWFEVQEYLSGGSLADLAERCGGRLDGAVLGAVIAEAAAALAAFHRSGLAHHDIKPSNILVRTDPEGGELDLVLGDFGLSVLAGDATHLLTKMHAAIAFQAPETMQKTGGRRRDYWALGLTIASVATGETPYAGLNEHGILSQHWARTPPPIIESMPEGRVKELCRGLTRYDPDLRWSEDEVAQWLRGLDPEVASEHGREAIPERSIEFAQQHHVDAPSLARSMTDNWPLGIEAIATSARRTAFIDDLLETFANNELAVVAASWRKAPPSSDRLDESLVELVLALDPEAAPRYLGHDLTPNNLAAMAVSGTDDQVIEAFRKRRILEPWSNSVHGQPLGPIVSSWREQLTELDQIRSRATAGGAQVAGLEGAEASLLAIAARPETASSWSSRLADARPTGEGLPSWYQQIALASTPAQTVAALLLAPEAEAVQTRWDEAQRSESDARNRERRQQLLNRLRSFLARVPFVLLVLGVAIEWQAGSQLGRLFASDAPLYDWNLWLLGLVGLIVVQSFWRTENVRWAELAGVASLFVVYRWLAADSPPIGLSLSTDIDALMGLASASFFLAGVVAAGWSVVSFASRLPARTSDGTEASLRAEDRQTVRSTAWWAGTLLVPAAVGAFLLHRELGGGSAENDVTMLVQASPINTLVAVAARGLWFPPALATFILVTRGRWARRRYGVTAAAAMAVVAAGAWLFGQALADARLDASRLDMASSPIPPGVAEGGRFCSSYWTSEITATRSYIAGPDCDTAYRYRGWTLMWSTNLGQSADELLSINGHLIALTSNRELALGIDPSSGDIVWQYHCPSRLSYDSSQLDGGVNTTNRDFTGTCGAGSFRLDPATGDRI